MVLTMMDQFTKWPVAVPLPDHTSAQVAYAIFKFWICEKGVPFRIVSDRGRDLVSKGMQQLCLKLGIMKCQRVDRTVSSISRSVALYCI